MMYLNNLSVRLTLRLSSEQMDFIVERANEFNVTPSVFLRMMIDSYMIKWGDSHEDEQAILDREL